MARFRFLDTKWAAFVAAVAVRGPTGAPGILASIPMASLTTSVESLEDNKVRLRVAVPAAEFEKAIDAAFRKLAREVKIPGFRPGQGARGSCSRRGSDPASPASRRSATRCPGTTPRPSWPRTSM